MIFYQPSIDFVFSRYGIEIPIEDNRSSKVFSLMKEIDPNLSYLKEEFIPPITPEDLCLAHNKLFIENLFGDYKKLEEEMLNSYELIDSEGNYNRYNPLNAQRDFTDALGLILKQIGMTYLSCKHSLTSGFSYFLGGGMHHAMSMSGRGFCLLSDIVIATRKLQNEKLVETVWVIDVDAHKGDGTAELTFNDSSIITLSIHMKTGWPLNSTNLNGPSFIPSNIDIEMERGSESFYNERLAAGLNQLEKKYKKPSLVIIVNGADPFEFDELQSANELNLTAEQLLVRDQLIFNFFKERKIPQTYLMAGGYGPKSYEIYFQFLKFVRENSSKWPEVCSR